MSFRALHKFMWKILSKQIFDRLKTLYDRVCSLPYVGKLVRAVDKEGETFDKDMAASIAYYTFLSLFPLMLGLIALGGFFLTSADMQAHVNKLIVDMLPVSGELVTKHIESLIKVRGAVGITSVIILLWSASKMMGALSRAVNRSLGINRPDFYYLSSLRYFAWTLIVTVFVFITMALSPVIEVLVELQLEIIGERWNEAFNIISGRTVGLLQTGIITGSIYLFLPYERIKFRAIISGVIVATVLIEAGKSLFSLYVGVLSHYSSVFGSLFSIIVLMFWLYYTARVILYGAGVIRVNNE